jgi:hypothetical protein
MSSVPLLTLCLPHTCFIPLLEAPKEGYWLLHVFTFFEQLDSTLGKELSECLIPCDTHGT